MSLTRIGSRIATVPTVISRIAACYLAALGVCVALLFVLTPAFHGGSSEYPVWDVVNWFMMVATPILLGINWLRKTRTEAHPDTVVTREYFAAHIAFYTSLGLIIIFWWQFLFGRFPDNEVGLAVTSHVNYYPIMDTVFAILGVHTGVYAWRYASQPD